MTDRTTQKKSPARRFLAPSWVVDLWTLAVPLGAVYLFTVVGSSLSGSARVDLGYALVNLIVVVGLWVFVGNSGVLSFGHIAFVAVGGWTMSLLTLDPTIKNNVLPALFPSVQDASASPVVALILGALIGGVLAFFSGLVLMKLNGLEAGIATFALLQVVVQVLTYWDKIGPKSGQSMVGIPTSFDLPAVMAIAMIVIVVAWLYRHSTSARLLRASRDDMAAAPASGINVFRHRVIAFAVSGALAGVGGALWAQTNRVVQASQFNLDFTFLTIAMLVIGGMLSLWGAVVGTIVISTLTHFLGILEGGVDLGEVTVSIPSGSRLIVLGLSLILILILRPGGITNGREAVWPFERKLDFLSQAHTSVTMPPTAVSTGANTVR
jgi:branched-chain amino acid transport system permease protein